jgi:hypothetical protein
MTRKPSQPSHPLTAPKLGKDEDTYQERVLTNNEISKLRKVLAKLEDHRAALDTKLETIFEKKGELTDDGYKVRLVNGTVVYRKLITCPEIVITQEMVGQVKRAEYSYPNYKEVANVK